jgi:hypothetical protein
MSKKLFFAIALLLCCTGFNNVVQAQDNDPKCSKAEDFQEWMNCRVDNAVKARINQRNPTKQSETPAISTGSTSLVDQSSASDLLNAALNLAGVDNNSDQPDRSSFSITVSAYALQTALQQRDPLDPAYYLQNRNWRRVWFTLGQELPDNDAPTGTQKANIYGVKILAWDKRDISDVDNRNRIKGVVDQMGLAGQKFGTMVREVQDYLYRTFGPALGFPGAGMTEVQAKIQFGNRLTTKESLASILGLLQEKDEEAIDEIIEANIDYEVQLADTLRETIEDIRRAPQFALAFQAKTRGDDGTDEYRGEAILDYGVANRVNLSLNASFDYKDNKITGEDMRGGRFARESQFQLTPETKLTGRSPWILSLGAEGEWMSQMTPTYQAQAKLTIPLIFGLNLPFSVSWANRTELIKESEVRGRFGFTFDIAKLANAFR